MWSVFFVFLSYLDRNFVRGDLLSRALDAEKESKEMFSMINGTFCAKMSAVSENFLFQVSDGTEVVRSVVSPAGKLVNCSIIVNQIQVKSFMHECRLGLKEQRAGRQLETHFVRMDAAKLMCQEFTERSERSGAVKREDSDDPALQDKVVKRSKRGFTYPGTLWCGAGNMADHYDQLGQFAATDSCCRIHDHCPHVIHSFSSKYGYTNFKWHSICHCDCDNALKDCLRKVNDTSSRVVGQAFFNVIGVPCFDLVYEEQCAERHWYGMCKRYENLPIAVLRDAVPYDFGGIDIIDVLTLPPSKNIDSKKNKKEDKPESTAQSTMSGPEEPSLRNVVTAAEDFIKVLATVSTSQSSTTDSDKAETPSSEKKKRKNTGKKKKTIKKKKGKGKWRKGKQRAEVGVQIEEGAGVSTPGSKAEETIALSNFLSESHKHDQASKNTNSIGDSEYELGGREEFVNDVMKDEPAMDKETISIMAATTIQKKPAESIDEITLPLSRMTTTVVPKKAKTRRQRQKRKKKSKTSPTSSTKELLTNTTDISIPTFITISPAAEPKHQSSESNTEKQPVTSSARASIVIPKVKRNRSKERRDREGRKKRRKDSSSSLIVAAPDENSPVDNLKVSPLTGTPTMPLVPITERKVSHRLDIYGGKTITQVMTLNSSVSALKRQKSRDRGLRSGRRKTVLPLSSSENLLFPNSSVNVLVVLPTPKTSNSLYNHATAAVIGRRTEETETQSESKLFTSVTTIPSIIRKRHRQTIKKQRKPQRKTSPAALSNGVSVLKETVQTTLTFTTMPPKVTTSEVLSLQRFGKTSMTTSTIPVMSPIQLSIERAKAQFTRKKRRKAALSLRQQ